MADSNEQEKLKITAELDTSKLKQEAKKGMQEVVNEEKKVEQQAKQTSKAVDDIGTKGKDVGNALQQAGSQGADALKQVGQEADKTAQKIANIDKSVKDLKLGQAFGLMSRFANSEIGQHFGNSVGDSLGMSDSDKGIAGSAIQGFLGGAAAGAMAGPWGAVIGGLAGAASALLKAGIELQNANKSEKEKADLEIGAAQAALDKQRSREEFVNLLSNGSDTQLEERLDYERNQLKQSDAGIKALQDRANRGTDENGFALTTEERVRLAKNLNDALEHRLKTLQNIAALEAESARRDREADARVARFLADEEAAITAQRDAEEQAKKKAEAKAKAEAEAKAKEEYNRQKAFDTYTIEQKRENISNLQETQLKPLESMMNGMASFRLTDSLTRIGGGAGYGVQMQGISRYVSNISNNIQTIKGIIQQELDAIRELSNKYKPYYGEFMAQQDN